jgi:hypothetical protein
LDTRAREVLRIGDAEFGKKKQIDSLWQEIALNFYPSRADFTNERAEGEEYADHLFSSFPVMCHRELGNLFAANLRDRSNKWFSIHVDDEELDEDDAARSFLEHITEIQWRLMYAKGTQFVRATKEADHDFAAFGNAVIWFGLNSNGNGLLYRNYHLRDCAWSENADGEIDCFHRNCEWTARQIKRLFPKTHSSQVAEACEKDPERKFKCRHVVMPARIYHYKSNLGKEYPFTSLYVECETMTVLEEVGLNYFPYVVPRWQTVSGSVYGISMATMILLPDGRTMQVMMRTLREAGEKYVDPPMIAIADAIRGDYALYAGGVTIADMEYDERLGDVLRPISQDRGGMPIGMELANALKEDIRSGFFLDKIIMNPVSGKEMTAFEFSQHLQQQIRQSAPIFEPITETYSDPLCDGTFELLKANGAFPIQMMPEILSDADIKFKFRSPLAEMEEQREAQIYSQVLTGIVAPAAQVDPAQIEQIDLTRSTRDAMRAAGWKQKWFKPLEAIEQRQQQVAEEMEQAKAMAMAKEMAEAGSKAAGGLAHGDKVMDALGKAPMVAQQLEAANAGAA